MISFNNSATVIQGQCNSILSAGAIVEEEGQIVELWNEEDGENFNWAYH